MTGPAPSRFLELSALAGLRRLRFATRRAIEGTFTGRHASRRHGGAGEFADFREYTDGEDLRRLDWKVLARTGRAYTRLHQDETNFVCTLVLDASESMRFGTPGPKMEYAQYLATALSQVIGWQQDQVGLAVAADGLRAFIPPAGTPRHVAHLQAAIEHLATRPASDLAGALRELFQRLTRRGVLLVLSDFLVDDPEAVFGAVRLFRHRAWEVVALHLIHPDEERLPEGEAFRFEGLENEGVVDCSPREVRAEYEAKFEAHAAAIRTLALAAGCDYRRVSTAVPYLHTLSGFLVERQG
ncbi:DUF58 domain-containing protein [Gemmata sp.]|uniref:DUF58 domain-containing protein n=1 Tax=Gemmata sp. TaxID=1914242 RepID=UPI003F6EC2A9